MNDPDAPGAAQTEKQTPETVLAAAIDAIGTRDFVLRALDYLRTALPFHGCFLTLLDGARAPVHIYDNVRAERRADVIDRYLDGAYLLDPFYTLYRQARPCTALSLREIAPDRFAQSSYFREYYGAIRLHDEAALLIDLPGGQHLFYSIGRLGREPRFSRRDIAGARRVLPVFAAINRRHFGAGHAGPQVQPGADIEAALARFGAGILTERETEIALLILKGHSTKSIAQQIDAAPGTVKIHRRNFYRKLGISSQNQLFSLFLETLLDAPGAQ